MVVADNPIRRREDDTLGRAAPARSFAEQILSLDASEGAVVGVLGAWGSGKTSFINLARTELSNAGATIVDFNPWMFSGAEQLVGAFFIELVAQLKVRGERFSDVAQRVEEYGEVLSGIAQLPVIGPWIYLGLKVILTRIRRNRKSGVDSLRAKVRDALVALKQPVVVVVDDIDRLSGPETRDVFKLVRLTASFPNIIYVVAFDRAQVEIALQEQGIPGRHYLEKILQVAVDLPEVPSQVLDRQLLTAIEGAMSAIDNSGSFDTKAWPDIFAEIVRPVVRNMRDVRRYAAAIHGTAKALNGQIALADVLGLEAVRAFLPDVFAQLHSTVEALTTTSGLGDSGRDDSARLKPSVDALIEVSGEHKDVVHSMIRRLFPAGESHIGGSHYGPEHQARWLRDRRVAHEEILRFYLERVAGQRLQAFYDAERAWDVMADTDAFEGYMRSLDVERLEDVIASLEAFEDMFTADRVVPGTIVLLNLLPHLPERPRGGMFDIRGPRLVVSRVVYRLLRSPGNPAAVEKAVREILPKLAWLSAKLQLIDTVGYRKGVGHKLVSEEAAAQFEEAWRSEVRSASALDLEHEGELLRVLLLAKREAKPGEPELEIPDVPDLTLAIVRTSRSEVLGQSMNSRAVRRSPRLAWDALTELFGHEEAFKERIRRLADSPHEGEGELLALVEKYLQGWRPKDFDDD